jgi:hypothetical protein
VVCSTKKKLLKRFRAAFPGINGTITCVLSRGLIKLNSSSSGTSIIYIIIIAWSSKVQVFSSSSSLPGFAHSHAYCWHDTVIIMIEGAAVVVVITMIRVEGVGTEMK